jgi:hypothetical protein
MNKQTLIVFFLVILSGGSARQLLAQKQSLPNSTELISVESKPSGAIVRFEGIYNFSGRTPFVIPYVLAGRYKVKAAKEGFENLSAEMDFVGADDGNLMLKLKSKTRLKAATRSLIFPGWGQIYGGDKLRGIAFSSIQMGLGIGTMLVIRDYNNANDDLKRATDAFTRHKDESTFLAMQDKLETADEKYNSRNTMLMIAAAFWTYNILDSILFFKPHGTQIEIRSSQISQNLSDEKIMLTLKMDL